MLALNVMNQGGADCGLSLQGSHFRVQLIQLRIAVNKLNHRLHNIGRELPWQTKKCATSIQIGRVTRYVIGNDPRAAPSAQMNFGTSFMRKIHE